MDEHDLSRLTPPQRVRRVHKMLIPPLVKAFLKGHKERRRYRITLKQRFAALDRTWAYAQSCTDIRVFGSWLLESARVLDAEMIDEAFEKALAEVAEDASQAESVPRDAHQISARVIGGWRSYARKAYETRHISYWPPDAMCPTKSP